MIILHIASIDNDPFNGVCVSVPQHVISQMSFADIKFLNVNNIIIDELRNYPGVQLKYTNSFSVKEFEEPYNKPDLVVFHECYRPQFLQIYRDLIKYDVPYVIIPHGELRDEAQNKKKIKKVIANLLLFNRFVNHASAIQCLSTSEMNATHFGKRKMVGTNGVSIPLLRKTVFNDDQTRFVYIGRYEWKVKGLDLLFGAIRDCSDFLRLNNCSFELYGPDKLGRVAQVTQMVKENHIEDIVSINLEISGKEKETKLLESDVFVQTSRHEGMPMGILEAMSYGIPCLITEGTTLGSIIRESDSGWVAQNTVSSISESIIKAVIEREKWKEKGNNGIELIKRDFSWSIVSESNISNYQHLLIS